MVRVTSIVWVALCLASTARGQPAGEADRLFDEGRAFAKQGKYAEACASFQRSFDLDHATGTELNLGDCHERLGHLRKAWELYTSAAEEFEAAGNAARSKFARERADAVAARLGTIVLRVPQPQPLGLAITVAGRVVQPRPEVKQLVEPGAVEITAAAPGRTGFVTTRQVGSGATLVVQVPALALEVLGTRAEAPRRPGRVRLAWGVLAGSAVTGLAAGGLTLLAKHDYDTTVDGPHCTHVTGGVTCDSSGTSAIHSAQLVADAGTGLAVACGALAVTGLIVYVSAPHDDVVVAPIAGLHTAGLSISGQF